MSSKALFLRMMEDEDKGAALLEAVRSVAAGETDLRVFEVDPASFEQVPGAPFAYWVGEPIRNVFVEFPAFEQDFRYARRGPSTCDDTRYLRLWFETPTERSHGLGRWLDFSKGGAFSRFYSDIHLLVEWEPGRGTFLGFFGRPGRMIEKPESVDYFFRPGVTWPLRTNGLSFRVMPAGCIFGHKGPAAFVPGDRPDALLSLCAVINSAPFKLLVELQLARTELAQSFEVGLIQQTPVPDLAPKDIARLASLARSAWSLKRDLDTATLTSHAFVLPALLQVEGANLDARAAAWSERVSRTEKALAEIQSEIDARCFDLYGFDEANRAAAMGSDASGTSGPEEDAETGDDDEDEAAGPSADPKAIAAELFDWLVGVAFGRFDLRLATGERAAPPEPDLSEPLPVCSPGMLTSEDGLPLAKAPPGYTLAFPADGILVDDGDESLGSARNDPIARIRSVLGILAAKMERGAGPGLAAETLEADLCRLLGVKTLRDWLRRPTGFFADHLGRWSKSRRKAPIYWPLSTESGGYTLWIYYPRLTDQTLYTCVNDYIDPKLQEIGSDLERLRGTGDLNAKARKRADALLELQREIQALREELMRVARLPYKPDQNDGVLITAAPLWRLFRHKPWQKELVKCWDTLEAGGYDWAHLALALWPERVRTLCRTDKSVAIAHGLEELYEG